VHPAVIKSTARVLLVDDEPNVTLGIKSALRKEPFDFVCAESGEQALEMLSKDPFDVIVSDERMPGMAGSQLLAIVRERHPDIARIILSGQATLEAALHAINSAQIYRFLLKPCPPKELEFAIREALAARDERCRLQAWEAEAAAAEPSALAEDYEGAMRGMWIGFQPIVHAPSGHLYGYEALLRNDLARWSVPNMFFSMAEKLGKTLDAGRNIRAAIAHCLDNAPLDAVVCVNVSPRELDDEMLVDGSEDLSKHAGRIVIEITERDSVKSISDLSEKVQRLRALGYRIAVDDLGAGYAGLSSIAAIMPDLVKFDMDLVRGIDESPTKQTLIEAMARMCHELRIQTLAEGIETPGENDTVTALGCDLLQGYYLGRAHRGFQLPTSHGHPSVTH
jgi:EAL domain-containing protein (putative c-di-GMP-specific phosphodiesterase class I)